MTDLVAHSIRVILDNQAPTGAYPAAVNYPTYKDCWFRDGSYIAHSMDVTGHPESSARFHDWVATIIIERAATIEKAVAHHQNGQPLDPSHLLHTRYTIQGTEGDTEWPNFQLDGLGTWLWALKQHTHLTNTPATADWAQAADLISEYLTVLWNQPCYDCWEEFSDKIHPHTLAAIHGGLRADQELFDRDHTPTLDSIRKTILERAVIDGHFTKYLGHDDIDTSLIGLVTPYEVIDPDHPAFLRTFELIETRLRHHGGGPHRYPTDTFYGGGEWVVLAGWLAWHHARTGDHEAARQLTTWIEQQADHVGDLPEQVSHHLNAPNRHQEWVNKWGPIAQPLLWSHANYLVAISAIKTE